MEAKALDILAVYGAGSAITTIAFLVFCFGRSKRRTMIELPPEILNVVFMLLIVAANISRMRQRSAAESAFRR